MLKKLLISTVYSTLIFSLTSYVSVMVSLLKSVGDPQMKPLANIGFPFTYYYQFWTRGADSPNCGWNFTYFMYDAIIVWLIVLIGYFYISKVSPKKSNHVN